MINDSMKSNKIIGMIQPQSLNDDKNIPKLHDVGCLGKITSFRETEDGRYLIELKGIQRFTKIREIETDKKYRTIQIDYKDFSNDLNDTEEELKFSDLELIFKDLKSFFERRFYNKLEST